MKEELEDQQWIDALSGKVAANQTASATETQAGVLRKLIFRQIEARPMYEPSPARFEMLLGEAKKQGLLKPEKTAWHPSDLISRIYEVLAMPSAVMASFALVLGLSVTVGYQANQMQVFEEEAVLGAEIVRKGGSAERVSQIVPSPLEAAQAWQKDLLAAGVAYTVSYEEPKRVLMRIQLTPAAIELLEARGRIQAPPGEWVTLVIEAEKTGS
jgi:hypothetical protein